MKSIRVAAPTQGWGETIALAPHHAPMIARLEQSALADPGGYRRRTVLAGLLGYAVLGGILAVFAGLSLAMIALMLTARAGLAVEIKLLLVFGGVSWALLRALWLTAGEREGVAVDAAAVPALFALRDRVHAAVGGPRVHEVRITSDLNAAITQDSRWFGLGVRNTLYLGLPLLQALPLREVEAVVAHELGHFTGAHGRSTGFAYGMRRRWMQVAEQLPGGVVAGALRRFFAWYGPWFAAYSFVLARRQEHEADAAAARVTDRATIGAALVRVAIQAGRRDAAWESIWDQAPLRDDPPRSPMALIADAFAGSDDGEDLLAMALDHDAAPDDTHPTLAARLGALGVAPAVPDGYEPAAPALLGDRLPTLLRHFDDAWHDHADRAWIDIFATRQRELGERTELADLVDRGVASLEQTRRHAALVGEIDGNAAAAPFWSAAATRFPAAGDLRYQLGVALLGSGDDAGIAVMAALARDDRDYAADAYRLIVFHLRFTGREAEAAEYQTLLAAAEEHQAHARAEAETIDERVVLRPLDPALRDELAAIVATVPGVKGVGAALRDLPLSTNPQIVFLFAAEKGVSASDLIDALIEALLPVGDLLGVAHDRKHRWLARRLDRIPGSRIVG